MPRRLRCRLDLGRPSLAAIPWLCNGIPYICVYSSREGVGEPTLTELSPCPCAPCALWLCHVCGLCVYRYVDVFRLWFRLRRAHAVCGEQGAQPVRTQRSDERGERAGWQQDGAECGFLRSCGWLCSSSSVGLGRRHRQKCQCMRRHRCALVHLFMSAIGQSCLAVQTNSR